ncbi:hypothetical protein PAXRUDRAFT_776420 [Paxillus rubicundulus Ve08.2h10]|uniref:Myb/SANT-like domain-containing protein n=1 Tax=Paxillus rubicundulus Ve08.2h10 TaxID=930991 RepID=A0A0D0DB22_9AGAM|nr:hypothetical protein PAXRUDRAFT_776420 [Paxillus rubicundulus Ve08.2h10]
MGDGCRSEWTTLKAAYHAVVDIKNTSGFTWSDDQGWHPAARPFKNKGFKHFHTIEQMMPEILKGTHVF